MHYSPCGVCGASVCDGCHENDDCSFCGADGCQVCMEACEVCEQFFGAECIGKCATCGKSACRGHMLLIPFQTGQHCQNCVDTKFPNVNPIVACEASITTDVDDSALTDFDPPVVLFLYKQRKGNKKGGLAKPPGDWQAEHPIPNSAFIVGSGRSGPTVPNSGSYCEAEAMCFWVEDDQTHGTEHKFITDYEREFTNHCQTHRQHPTVEQWFRVMENGWKELLVQQRTYVGAQGSTPSETENKKQLAAARAAHVMRVKLQRHYFKKLKISQTDCYTKIGFQKGTAPKPQLKNQSAYTGF